MSQSVPNQLVKSRSKLLAQIISLVYLDLERRKINSAATLPIVFSVLSTTKVKHNYERST